MASKDLYDYSLATTTSYFVYWYGVFSMNPLEYLIDTLYDQDIHPRTGEYAPNRSEVLHVLEIVADMVDLGLLTDSRDFYNLIEQLSARVSEDEVVNISLTSLNDWGHETNIVHVY